MTTMNRTRALGQLNLQSSTLRRRTGDFMAALVLTLGATTTLLPLAIMIFTALTQDAFAMSFPYRILPDPWYWQNLLEVWRLIPLGKGFLNTLTVSLTVTVVGMFTSSLAAFAFAKLEFPGRERLFFLLLGTMMIPYAVVLIPQYIAFSRMHWVNSLKPLIVPGLFGNVAVVFFLRQFFKGLPDDLVHSARIDGAGFFLIYRVIILPLGIPAIAAQGVLSFMGCWNDFFGPMIYLNSPKVQTVQVLLTNFQGLYNSNFSLIMAASLQAMLPLILLFLFAQRYIIESLAVTGIKG